MLTDVYRIYGYTGHLACMYAWVLFALMYLSFSPSLLFLYIHSYIHTFIHSYIHIYIHTYIHIYIETHTYIRKHISNPCAKLHPETHIIILRFTSSS